MIHENVEQAKGGCSSKANAADAAKQQEAMVKDTLSKIKNKIFVMSGKGGVGKSSVASNLAVTLAEKGFKVGLMDVDLHGPSVAGIMGLSGLMDIAEDQQRLLPKPCGENLSVVSMQSLMQDQDQAVIWRGPAKNGMIKQFVGSVLWGDLDFLVIDAPPGTGDEPLTVVQTIPEAQAVIVTTPQEVALADVRKSISFCNTVKLKIAGLVENMGPFKCPGCDTVMELFKSGGGKRTAEKADINFLGTLPFDPKVVDACDSGKPIARNEKTSDFAVALGEVADTLVKNL